MKTNTITKTQDLIDALKSNRLSRLVWQMGSKPAVKGSYWIDSVRVYTSAVHGAEKIGALKCISANFISRQYVLTPKFQKVKQ